MKTPPEPKAAPVCYIATCFDTFGKGATPDEAMRKLEAVCSDQYGHSADTTLTRIYAVSAEAKAKLSIEWDN